MKKQGHATAFYLEVLLLAVCLIFVVLVLTRLFALGRLESGRARELTDAVCLAQTAAEAFSAAADPEELAALLDEGGNTELLSHTALPTVRAAYDADLSPNEHGVIVLTVSWEEQSAGKGRLVRAVVTVCGNGGEREIYSLQTAAWRKEAAA